MLKKLIKHMIQFPEGDASGGGGAAAGASGSGDSGSLLNGAAGNAGAGAAASGEGAGAASGSSGASDWRMGIEEDILKDPAFKNVKDVPSLARSYVHAQRMVGADKFTVPGKNATEQDWQNIYQKLGLPADPKEYSPEAPKDFNFDKEFMDSFKDQAYKAGVLPKQASQLLNWYAGVTKSSLGKNASQIELQRTDNLNALKKEWGAAFNDNVQLANMALKEYQGDSKDLETALNKAGLGTNPAVLKFLAKLGEGLKEDGIKGGGDAALQGRLSPTAAKEKYNEIMGDKSHPYFNDGHPAHKDAVKEMQRLFQMANPS